MIGVPWSLMGEPTYNGRKFREMLVYIAGKSQDDPRCGDLKLNKLLYFADMTAYRRRGTPITGAKYQHQPHGPIATPLIPARRQLEAEKRVSTEKRSYFTKAQRCTCVHKAADPSQFDPDELAIMDEVIAKYWDWDAQAMEDEAHKEPAWRLTNDGETISYRSALIGRTASPGAVALGHELATRLGW
jgi:uncharacterized phage-associated protein